LVSVGPGTKEPTYVVARQGCRFREAQGDCRIVWPRPDRSAHNRRHDVLRSEPFVFEGRDLRGGDLGGRAGCQGGHFAALPDLTKYLTS
jgi:hypothetical protein